MGCGRQGEREKEIQKKVRQRERTGEIHDADVNK
jgi:hypothetical protein